jgi:hypothetical protein
MPKTHTVMSVATGKLATWLIAVTFATGLFTPCAMSDPLKNLQSELQSDFFSFFHLAPAGDPIAVAGGQAWHSFRPSGPAFHALVEVDVLTGSTGTIAAASLGIARSFINDARNGVFARDIAKSFLAWAIRSPSPQIGNLIANVADFARSGTPVIMRGSVPAPPPPDTTGLFDVYLGNAAGATITDGGITLTFTNFAGVLPAARIFDAAAAPAAAGDEAAGWLRIDVRL